MQLKENKLKYPGRNTASVVGAITDSITPTKTLYTLCMCVVQEVMGCVDPEVKRCVDPDVVRCVDPEVMRCVDQEVMRCVDPG